MAENREDNTQIKEQPWYAGVNIESHGKYKSEADKLCSQYIKCLLATPPSRGIELILDTFEVQRDSRMIADCLSDAMAYIAYTPAERIVEVLAGVSEKPDYTTTHGFDHRQTEIRGALGMSDEEFEMAQRLVTLISGEMFKAGLKGPYESKVEPRKTAPIFERILDSGEWTQLQKAAALYMFLMMPISYRVNLISMLNAELSPAIVGFKSE
jgi:hypothetical protein